MSGVLQQLHDEVRTLQITSLYYLKSFFFFIKNVDPQPDPEKVALKCELKEANEQIDVLKKNINDLRDSVAKLTERVNNLQQENKKLNEKLRCVEGYNSNGNETNN